jgi:hypothetical protein
MAEYEAGEGAPRVEDAPAVQLPSFDDFRRRDAAAAATGAAEPASYDERGTPQPAAPARGEPQNAAERLMELLAFDTIDERPRNEDPYDATARIIGRGLPNKAGAYTLPYLQTGHMLLLGVLLLSSSISYPGFPLTEESRTFTQRMPAPASWPLVLGPALHSSYKLAQPILSRDVSAQAWLPLPHQVPDEYRELLCRGLLLTFAINAASAIYARGIAEKKQQPVNFWCAKVFLFGGLALGELTQAVPDAPPPKKRPGRL